jgi:SRSO17 transposase
METLLDLDGQRRLLEYLTQIGDSLHFAKKKASFATYALGLLGEGERKSIEPIAARSCADPGKTDSAHQRLLHFVSNSEWSDRDVRRIAARYAVSEMTSHAPIDSWVIDDTGFLKQGKHSVGVQRQYTGSAGKITNCQIGVSLTLANRIDHVPIDFELYLPQSWTEAPERRREARIPDEIQFRTKPQLAIEMVRRAIADGLPKAPVLADAAYGDSSVFRNELRQLGLDYAVAVSSNTKVWCCDRLARRRGEALCVEELATGMLPRFRRTTWRQGTKTKLSARFAMQRVVPFHDDGIPPSVREDVWLLMEWEDSEKAPTKYYFINLDPRIAVTKKMLVRLVKQRWRTERVYQDMKGELGLDHFEGRRYRGWHHHVSVALCCFAFVVAERCRLFPPSAGEEASAGTYSLAA